MTSAAWVDPDLVKSHLGETALDATPYLRAAADYVRRHRLDLTLDDTLGPDDIDGDIQLGTVLLTARLIARRGTMLGLAAFGDAGIGSILRSDPDITRLLGLGVQQPPGWTDMGRLSSAAVELVELVQAALDDDPRTKTATATTDPAVASTASLAGGAILIGWPTVHPCATVAGDWLAEWTLQVAVRPHPSLAAAFDRLDDLLDVLAGVLDIDSANPASFADPTATEPRVGYLVTLVPIDL